MCQNSISLPSAKQLQKLPLRAVVAYAARNARRLSSELRGMIADEVLDDLLQQVESVFSTDRIGNPDEPSIVRTAERLAAAYEDTPDSLKSPGKFRIVFCLGHAATAAELALVAASHPENASFEREQAADEAERTARPIEVLSTKDANAAMEAARQDYETLLREYGQYENVVIGGPVRCFDTR